MFARQSACGMVVPCVIDGHAVSLPESQNFPVIQSKTGQTVHLAQGATTYVAVKAVEAAAQALESWQEMHVLERTEILNRAANLLEQNVDEVIKRETSETSCLMSRARGECMVAAEIIRVNAAAARTLCGRAQPGNSSEHASFLLEEPVGVVLVIPPPNAPMIMACRSISGALAVGCTVVMKASEFSPWSFQLLLEIFKEAGLPDGVLNQIQCPRKDAESITDIIIGHHSLGKVEFVGSDHVGGIIGVMAVENGKPVPLKQGDKSTAIILEDADLQQAADKCAFGVLLNHGQLSLSIKRILVHNKVRDAFLKEFSAVMRERTSTGYAITTEDARQAHDLISEALNHGAEIVIGENTLGRRSFVRPCIITNVNTISRIYRDQVWSPCAIFDTFSTTEEAVKMANNTNFGSSASVFTKDLDKVARLRRKLRFRQVQPNASTVDDVLSTSGTGFKNSVFGSNGGCGIEGFIVAQDLRLTPGNVDWDSFF